MISSSQPLPRSFASVSSAEARGPSSQPGPAPENGPCSSRSSTPRANPDLTLDQVEPETVDQESVRVAVRDRVVPKGLSFFALSTSTWIH